METALRLHETLVDLINVGWSLKLANSILLPVFTEHLKKREKKISDEKFMALFLVYGAETCSCGKHEVASRHGWDENFPLSQNPHSIFHTNKFEWRMLSRERERMEHLKSIFKNS